MRRGVAAGAVLALVAVLGACSGGTDDRQRAADALAEAIASGDFADVPLDGATAAEAGEARTAAYAGLDPWQPEVVAGDVVAATDDDAAASVELTFTWDVGGGGTAWTYATHANLAKVDDQWRARWSPMLLAPDLAAGETLQVHRVQAERADVLGAGDAVLVESRPVFRIGIDKTRVPAADADAAARQLATMLGLDPEAYAAQVAAAGEKAFVEAIVVRADDPAYDRGALSVVPGVNMLETALPLAPTRAFARPVLGTVGQATAEIVEESGGAVVAGDLAGLSGLQAQFDEQLRGEPGLTVVASAGAQERELFHTEPVVGEPLRTTLDPRVQQAAEDLVATVAGSASAIVAIRPSTGDVLAAASGPGGGGMSTATLGLYAPGSTFKVATSLALLRAGLTPDSTVTCPPTATVDGRSFQNYPGYPSDALGDITLRTAVAESCNTAFLTAAGTAPQEALAAAAASLGLVPDADLGFAATLGEVPAEATGGTDHAASMIGQARVQATPLGMATVAASVAAGARVTPRLLLGGAGETATAAPAPAQPLTAEESAALRSMMRAVVTEGGGDFLQDVPGPEVIAKSGTAQYGSGDDLQNHAWMIAAQGDLAVAVFVETGDFGSTTSGPLLESFLRAVAVPAA
ncbi:penicillin-binding protein [Cellulomonas sp. ACRRI]|uniref:penicillin-binding transpeptidase domain-containing protein n=1 Tax=Cellulomonas sp. ACRRI TaxID=2918188 RepID=UPI001EF22533|nr:penicillin-binding transpeptidase domain-containing protein [Cellulomonas sp. ACRRI]MCG7284589.1 penicillin-binding protein [Cellulomonas sp. ACRRI]